MLMIEKLRQKLICIFMLFMVLIFTLIIFFSLHNSLQKEREYEKSFLQNILTSLTYQLLSSNQISDSLLDSLEQKYKMFIQIDSEDFTYAPADTNIDILFDQLEQIISEDNSLEIETAPDSILLPYQSNVSSVKGEYSGEYWGAISQLPVDGPQTMKIKILIPKTTLPKDFGYYILGWIIIMILLYFMGRYLVGQALAPVISNMHRQKEFVAAASHELKSPLSIILSVLSSVVIESDENKHLIHLAWEEGERMSKLISNLLFLASSDAAKFESKKEPIYLDNILIDTYSAFTPLSSEKNISLTIELPDSKIPKFLGNKDYLIQLFSILLDNAIAYSKEDSEINISLIETDKFLNINIIDHGIGISDAEKNLVFDRFYQSDRSRSNKNHFGLGLSIADELIQFHDAHIKLCDTPGGGCTVMLYFPHF